jgi:hypothetical protein
MALVEEAVDLQRGHGRLGGDFDDPFEPMDNRSFSRTTEQVNAVLKREKEARSFPLVEPFYGPFEEEHEEEEEGYLPSVGDMLRLLLDSAKTKGKKKAGKKQRSESPEQRSLF